MGFRALLRCGIFLFSAVSYSQTAREWILTRSPSRQAWTTARNQIKGKVNWVKFFGPNEEHVLLRFARARAFHLPGWQTQPNREYRELEVDPDLEKSWGLINTGQNVGAFGAGVVGADIEVQKAWEVTNGSPETVVAVIDSGISKHEDLKLGIWRNVKEIAGNGRDDDGNGYVDDVSGWNFVDQNADNSDKRGHGTFCTGLIVADRENGLGSRGVAPGARVMPLKMINDSGVGDTATAVEAIDYAIKNGARVLSLSWGGRGEDPVLEAALKRAGEKNILIVAAAGNDGINNDLDFKPVYPASYELPTLISVAAYDPKNRIAEFSNYGQNRVHLGAPGVEIFSTTPTGYAAKQGTSFAAPLVAGVAALVLSKFPELNAEALKNRILNAATSIGYYERFRTKTGGRLSALGALEARIAPRPPTPSKWRRQDYQFSSPHPYSANSNFRVTIKHPGAKFMRVHFSRFELESDFDTVTVIDGAGTRVYSHSGRRGDLLSAEAMGDSITLEFQSDFVRNEYGFDIDAYEISE